MLQLEYHGSAFKTCTKVLIYRNATDGQTHLEAVLRRGNPVRLGGGGDPPVRVSAGEVGPLRETRGPGGAELLRGWKLLRRKNERIQSQAGREGGKADRQAGSALQFRTRGKNPFTGRMHHKRRRFGGLTLSPHCETKMDNERFTVGVSLTCTFYLLVILGRTTSFAALRKIRWTTSVLCGRESYFTS